MFLSGAQTICVFVSIERRLGPSEVASAASRYFPAARAGVVGVSMFHLPAKPSWVPTR